MADIDELRTKATRGDARAQCKLGVLCYDGKDVEEDYLKAAHWFKLSAKQGDAWAQNDLANLYYEGHDVEDYTGAANWYRMTAQQGNTAAQLALGMMYSQALVWAKTSLLLRIGSS